ncbi:uncharacterized protein VP01_4852g1 [Puccinia sorghi]|uniref:Retrotransposon gag domain-containing protein n=1 Tax=Puccinia sorghi TaxID=27349 RepID=A0A0L6UMD0_9BASI|nr:uncharacterized protein VP01_4852g1 [Puccinia sorghi]
MQRTPPQTRSQGLAQHPLDPDLERCQQRSPSDLPRSLDSSSNSFRPSKPLVPWVPSFLQSCKLLFSNDPTVFSDDRKKVLYAASYLGGRASKWFEPYLDLLKNQSPSCLINNWDQFEQQLFTLFGDPNEVRNTKFELNSLSMKDNGKASTYIAQFRTLPSRLALTGQRLKKLQQLIDQTIKLDNCYHDKVRSSRKIQSTPSTSKNEDASRHKSSKRFPSKPSTPFASSSASPPKRSTKISLVLNKEGQLNGDERARREKEGLCLYCGGKHELDSCVKRIC